MPTEAPIQDLEVVQRGIEATAGTLVPATHRVPLEPGSLAPGLIYDRVRRRYSGSSATSHSSSTTLQHSTASWKQPGYYDDLAVMLSQCLAPTITGTGATADKSWVFLPSDSAPDAVKRVSLEVGGRDTWPDEERLAGCVVESLEVTWRKEGDWTIAVTYRGVRNTQGAKVAALTMPATLVPILGKLTKVYIDPTTFGTTLQGRALSGMLRIRNRLSERFGADGNDYANRIVVLGRTVSAHVIAEYDDPNGRAARAAWRAGTLQKLRLVNTGPVLGSSFYSALFDIPGTFDTSVLNDDKGILTLAHDLTAEYNITLAADISATIVCSLAAIP